MTKKIKKLEKETMVWRTKWENNNKALLQMAEEVRWLPARRVWLVQVREARHLATLLSQLRTGQSWAERGSAECSLSRQDLGCREDPEWGVGFPTTQPAVIPSL